MSTLQQAHLLTGNLAFIKSDEGKTEFKHTTITPKIIAKQNIYPKQRLEMLQKYRKYVQEYSDLCSKRNKSVQDYNALVDAYVKNNSYEERSETETNLFESNLGKVSIVEYNQAVIIANKHLGEKLIKQKRFIPVRKAIEHTFSMVLFKYSMQIKEKNNMLESCKATTVRAIQKIKINPHELSNTIIDGVNTLPYCKKTIQNHIYRLIDAGVLFNHEYRGYYYHSDPKMRSGKPSEYHVNSKILVMFDDKSQKTLNAENQFFNYGFEKNLRYNEIVTRTYKDNSNINEIVNNQSQNKEIKPLSEILPNFLKSTKVDNQNIYKNTNSVNQQENLTGRNFYCEKSEYLRQTIKETSDFLHELTDGYHDNHKFKLKKLFEHQVISGNLIKEEFFEVVVQEFMRLVAPLYKDKEVYYGSWHNSYQEIRELFLNNNGTIPSQTVLLYKFEGLHWRITYAKNYYKSKKNDCRVLFPSEYFDPTRTCSKSGGFAYTLNFWKKKQEFEDNKHKLKDEKRRAAAKRNLRYKAITNIESKVKQLANGKISITQLQDYVVNNQSIPIDIKQKLPLYIQKIYKC